MNIYHGIPDDASQLAGILSIGNFDGVHLGHQQILRVLVKQACDLSLPAVAMTFDPHPLTLLNPENRPPQLTQRDQKIELIAASGVDHLIIYPTTGSLLNMTPHAFFEDILCKELEMKGLVEGPNFFFGKNRAGNVKLLEQFCSRAGLAFHIVMPQIIDGQMVSSTAIRNQIASGDVKSAAAFLGRPYQIRGTVITGNARGRTLGFPTANLSQIHNLIPQNGVYAGTVQLLDEDNKPVDPVYSAAIHVGPIPTFHDEQRRIEVHLLQFEGSLYDQMLAVNFIEQIRETRLFADAAELQQQLQIDISLVRQCVSERQSN